MKEFDELVSELRHEAWKLGYETALYNHGGTAFHTAEKRESIKNLEAILDKVQYEMEQIVVEGK